MSSILNHSKLRHSLSLTPWHCPTCQKPNIGSRKYCKFCLNSPRQKHSTQHSKHHFNQISALNATASLFCSCSTQFASLYQKLSSYEASGQNTCGLCGKIRDPEKYMENDSQRSFQSGDAKRDLKVEQAGRALKMGRLRTVRHLERVPSGMTFPVVVHSTKDGFQEMRKRKHTLEPPKPQRSKSTPATMPVSRAKQRNRSPPVVDTSKQHYITYSFSVPTPATTPPLSILDEITKRKNSLDHYVPPLEKGVSENMRKRATLNNATFSTNSALPPLSKVVSSCTSSASSTPRSRELALKTSTHIYTFPSFEGCKPVFCRNKLFASVRHPHNTKFNCIYEFFPHQLSRLPFLHLGSTQSRNRIQNGSVLVARKNTILMLNVVPRSVSNASLYEPYRYIMEYNIDSQSWESLRVAGVGPQHGFTSESLLYDEAEDALYVWSLENLYRLDFAQNIWQVVLARSEVPLPRKDGCLVKQGNVLMYIGGVEWTGSAQQDSPTVLDDLACFDTDTFRWRCENYLDAPARYGHCAAVVRNSVFVFGGKDGDHVQRNQLFCFNLSTKVWREIDMMVRFTSKFEDIMFAYTDRKSEFIVMQRRSVSSARQEGVEIMQICIPSWEQDVHEEMARLWYANVWCDVQVLCRV